MPSQSLITFDDSTRHALAELLQQQHAHLAQHHLPTSERSSTAKNYDSGIDSLRTYMAYHQVSLPTKSLLERWRDDLLAGRPPVPQAYAVRSVNAKLAAVRKLLRAVADDLVNIELKFALRDWASIANAKALVLQDETESDYGVRLSLDELQQVINQIDTTQIKGLRDRALLAVMSGAGLRLSEVSNLTMRDMFDTYNEQGQRGIKIRRGKYGKQRVVVVDTWNSWVIQAVQIYTDALALTMDADADEKVFRGVNSNRDGSYTTQGQHLSTRGVGRAVESLSAVSQGRSIQLAAHDLRRTFAKLCKTYGMSWEALREQMGHSSVKITEDYVGHEVNWEERVPNWRIQL